MYKLDFTTFYNQFYITSDNGDAAFASGLDWSEESYNDRIGVFNKTLVIYTESYGHIKGELYLLKNAEQLADYSNCDHVVEAGINIESGIIQLLDCPSCQVNLEIQVLPGNYGVRVSFFNMSGFDSDEEESDDYHRIEIWPDDNIGKNVIKMYPRKF
ncbi:MAG: hypothetical protein JWR50_3895 [Mucilaginibacter sp.]|nr:hypothetical protein [Mucilaginibacter sp.]